MGPIVKECEKSYADKSIGFITFDFTSDETKAVAKAAATDAGVADIYKKKAPGTGFLLLWDTAAKKVVGTLSAANSTEEWHAAIDKALGES